MRELKKRLMLALSLCAFLSESAVVAQGFRWRDELKHGSVEILADGHLVGSGCFVSSNGLVATAAHVVRDSARTIEILTSKGERLDASFVAVDLGHDLILMRSDKGKYQYPYLKLREEKLPRPGEEVYLFSNSVFRHFILQKGIMAKSETTFEFQGHFVEVIQISGFVQIGSSGGPWIDKEGRIIGIQSGAVTSQNQFAGVANVAPVTALAKLLNEKKNVPTSSVGMFLDEAWILNANQLKQFPPRTNGLVVQATVKNGPAAKAGIKKGDLIIGFDDAQAQYRDDFVRSIRKRKAGSKIRIQYLRPGKSREFEANVTIGRLQHSWSNPSARRTKLPNSKR